MRAVDEIMGEDARVALVTTWPHDAHVGRRVASQRTRRRRRPSMADELSVIIDSVEIISNGNLLEFHLISFQSMNIKYNHVCVRELRVQHV